MRAAKLVVSRAQGEYEALEKERENIGKRGADGEGEEREGGSKRQKVEEGDDDEMEIEMDEEDDDGELEDRAEMMGRMIWVEIG